MTVSTLQITAVKPNDYNPNQMGPDKFAELVEEVRHLGRLPKPIVVKANGEGYTIIDGEHGWRAAQEVGLETVAAEVIEADDFESRRQTYKRNQHGEHNPVLLGRMFRDMMAQRELSQRGLAKEITVSEGTIRNALLYAEAADLRNSYAQEKDLEVDGDAQVAALTVRQVRYLDKIQMAAPGLAGLWLESGADLKALHGVKTTEDVEAAERTIRENERDPILHVADSLSQWEESGLVEFAQIPTGPDSFQETFNQIVTWRKFEKKWTWGLFDRCLKLEELRPYMRHHFEGNFYVREERMMEAALNVLIDTATTPPRFYLTPQEFRAVLVETESAGRQNHQDLMDRLKLAVVNKGGPVHPKSMIGVRLELMQREIDADAPDYIRESTVRGVEDKYLLWKLSGSEDAKRELATQALIPGKNAEPEARIAAAIENAEWKIKERKRDEERRARYEKASRTDLATALADRLFAGIYKDNPDALRAVTGRLARLEKTEIFALDEFVASEQRINAWANAFRTIGAAIS